MKSRKFLTIVIIASFCTASYCQTTPENPLPHFVFPGFTKGVTRMKDGKVFSSNLNYSMLDEIMVTELDGKYRYARDISDIDTVFIEYKKFVPAGKVFYEVLTQGSVSLFLQHKCTLTPRGSNVGYGAKSQSVGKTSYQRFELDPGNNSGKWNVVNIDLPPDMDLVHASVYWVRKEGNYEKFTTLGQFTKLFPENQAALKEYIKNENISMKSREDLIRLVNFCNTLIK